MNTEDRDKGKAAVQRLETFTIQKPKLVYDKEQLKASITGTLLDKNEISLSRKVSRSVI